MAIIEEFEAYISAACPSVQRAMVVRQPGVFSRGLGQVERSGLPLAHNAV